MNHSEQGNAPRLAGTVLGVVGGCGGIGASTFAAVLATVAVGAVLVDLDGTAGGIDVLLGIERAPGARWSQLRIGGGQLDAALLSRGLPHWGEVPVLSADAGLPPPEALGTVLAAAAASGPAVVNLPRGPGPVQEEAVSLCDVVVMLSSATMRGIAGARAVVNALEASVIGLVLRRGEVGASRAAHLVGVPLVGTLPALGAARDQAWEPTRVPARSVRVATGVLDGLGPRGFARPGPGTRRHREVRT